MPHEVCPAWLGYFLASPIRRLLQKPEQILAGLATPGMTVLEVGPGMGFFTLPLARMVGPTGQVIAVDVQEAMLHGLRKRAEAARIGDRITTRVCPSTSLDVADFAGKVDFALVFAVVHELPSRDRFFLEVAEVLKPGAQCLLAEPTGHVSLDGFAATLDAAQQAGLRVNSRPHIRASRAALLEKNR